MLRQSNLFEALGFRYFGPVDGHDVNHLIKVLRDLKDIKGPKLLHCITVKGKGFKQAEIDQTTWHAPGKFNKETGELIKENKPNTPPKFQDVFGIPFWNWHTPIPRSWESPLPCPVDAP